MGKFKKENSSGGDRSKLESRKAVIRYLIYLIFAFFGYFLMRSLHAPVISPLYPLALAIIVSVYETSSSFTTAVFSLVCGLLLDKAVGTLVGFHGVLLVMMSVLISQLFHNYLSRRFFNSTIFLVVFSAVQSLLQYVFFYLLWGYDKSGKIFGSIFIPQFIYTVISGMIFYLVIKLVWHFLGDVREYYDEEV